MATTFCSRFLQVFILSVFSDVVEALVVVADSSSQLHLSQPPSPITESTSLWLSKQSPNSSSLSVQPNATIIRVLDDGTILLNRENRRESIRKLEGIRLIPASRYPSCLSLTPAGKLQQLLPPNTKVRVQQDDGIHLIVIAATGVVVQERLLQLGYATTPNKDWDYLQQQAQQQGKGVYITCDASFQAEFDDYLARSSVRDATSSTTLSSTNPQPPSNPGDRVGCSDFDYYEDALRYYERYQPWYGDVAKLDRDGDGVPCPGLPHTPNAVLYRMKKPTTIGQKR